MCMAGFGGERNEERCFTGSGVNYRLHGFYGTPIDRSYVYVGFNRIVVNGGGNERLLLF